MRFNHRSVTHWFAVAIVLGLGLFTLNHARGEGANASAVFEGRPAVVDAHAGVGAQGVTLVPRRKGEVVRDMRTPVQKAKKAVKRTFQRSRTGVGEIDALGLAPL